MFLPPVLVQWCTFPKWDLQKLYFYQNYILFSVVAGNNEGYNGLGGHSEDRLCKFYRFNGNCKRGKNCSFLHVQTGSPFNMSDNDAVMTVTHHELELPGPGEKIDNIKHSLNIRTGSS